MRCGQLVSSKGQWRLPALVLILCLCTGTSVAQQFPPDDSAIPTDNLFQGDSAEGKAAAAGVDLTSVETCAEALERLEKLNQKSGRLTTAQLATLREWDRRWASQREPTSQQLAEQVTRYLAASGEARSLEYLHQVFESMPERRQSIAVALAAYAQKTRRRPQDWRLLVRSLPILEDRAVEQVIVALRAFPQRGTRAEWQRQVILAGLRAGQDAVAEAIQLLQAWTDQSYSSLADWQDWFHRTHPNQPKAELPVDPPDAKYKYDQLLTFLRGKKGASGDPKAGAEIYERAFCIRCHRFRNRGEAMGGDLTSVRRKFQDKELLQSLLYPSFTIPEEYAAKTLVDERDRRYTGVTTNAGDKVIVLKANGEKVALLRETIQEIQPTSRSSMPEGLLDLLTLQEIADLFAYLRSPSEGTGY